MHGCQDVGKTIQISRILLSRFLKQSLAHCSWYDYLVTESIEPPLMSVGGGGRRGESQRSHVQPVNSCQMGSLLLLGGNNIPPQKLLPPLILLQSSPNQCKMWVIPQCKLKCVSQPFWHFLLSFQNK